MSGPTPSSAARRPRERILVLAPTAGDAQVCRRFLAEVGLEVAVFEGPQELCADLAEPPGVLVIAEEALQGPSGECIRAALARQEQWSALPLVVLTRSLGRASLHLLDAYEVYGRATPLERPVRMATFVSTVQMALSERRQQYRVRDLLAERGERVRERDEFLAMLGHELRNPLAAIMTCTEVLQIADPDSEHVRHCRQVIASQSQQMKRLLDDLLDVSRITRQKLALQRERVDLKGVIADAVAQVRGEIDAQGQHLDLDLPASELPLFADPTRLRQVFANLLTNASRYSPPGTRIGVAAQRLDGLAVVHIRDQGRGMTPETLANVFKPFFQADQRGRGARGGLGVGLTLARSLVEMHAGAISAASPGPGEGSDFEVRLPLHDGLGCASPAAANATGDCAAAPLTRRILLIEDNRDFGLGLKMLLEDQGHEVHLAHDGPAGIRAARDHSPDVVVLDIGLPGLDGWEVARRLHHIPGLSNVRLVAVSGFGREDDKRRSRRAGIHTHLVKPVHMPDLEAAIAGG